MPDRDHLDREPLSDEELEQLAQVTPEDVEAAVESFNRYAPHNALGLLDVEAEDGDGE